jgi:hypothetical protein
VAANIQTFQPHFFGFIFQISPKSQKLNTSSRNIMHCNVMTVTQIVKTRETSTERFMTNPAVFTKQSFSTIRKHPFATAIEDTLIDTNPDQK